MPAREGRAVCRVVVILISPKRCPQSMIDHHGNIVLRMMGIPTKLPPPDLWERSAHFGLWWEEGEHLYAPYEPLHIGSALHKFVIFAFVFLPDKILKDDMAGLPLRDEGKQASFEPEITGHAA